MIIFNPRPGYVVIEHLPSETSKVQQNAAFLVPETYESEKDRTPYVVVKLLRKHEEDLKDIYPGHLIVVERAMIETIKFLNESPDVVHVRHVVGEFIEQ